MQLPVYTPQVQKTAGGDARIAVPHNIGAAAELAGQGINALGKGMGAVNAVLFKQAADADKTTATAANNEYTQRLNDVLYNDKDGLLHTQMKGADGITSVFEEKEKQIREEIAKKYKFNFNAGRQEFDNMASRTYGQRMTNVQNHMYAESKKYRDVTFSNAIDNQARFAADNYADAAMVEDAMAGALANVDNYYAGQGTEVVEQQRRRIAGQIAQQVINYALKAGDLNAASVLLDKYAGVIDTSKLPDIVGTIRAQREDNFMADTAMRLARSGLKGAALEDVINGLQIPGTSGSFENLEKMSRATLGQPYKLGTAGNDGSWDCGLWTQTMLNNNGENIQVRTADGQYAQMEREGRAFHDASKLKPGDLVFWHTTDRWKYTDNPNAGADEAYKGISHVGIYMGNGKVRQAGGSGVSDIGLNDYEVIGFGRTTIGSAAQGRNLDSTQKMRLASMVNTERAKQKRIEAEAKDEMLNNAWERFRADGPLADPDAIAKEIAGNDIKMKDTIANLLTAEKYKIAQKGVNDATMSTVFEMIKAGNFESMTDAIRFVQVPGRQANTKQVDQIKKWYNDKLNLKGQFGYDHLEQFLTDAVAGEKDQSAKFARKTRLRTYAENFINEYRKRNNGQDPSYQELQAALSKDVTETKMIATTYDGQKFTYDALTNADNGIISAVPYGEGMMRVKFRDPSKNRFGSTEVIMPATEYAELIGAEVQSSWFGNDEGINNDVTSLNLR